jgi:DNA-binding CsgD family transcriptional regulator
MNAHLKNLFAKLGAGTRKHAVERARLLGILPSSEEAVP